MAFTGRTREYQTVEEFTEAIVSYFTEVDEENKKSMKTIKRLTRSPNIAGLCNHVGLVKSTFYEYAKRVDCNNKAFSNSIKMASQYLEDYKLENASLGLLREITTIFDLKNNHGYTDKQEVVNINQDSNKLSLDDIDKLEKEE